MSNRIMENTLAVMQKEVAVLQANLALRDLKSRYWRAVDRQDLNTIRDCLLPDAKVDMEGVGVMTGKEFVDFIERNGCRPGLYNLHAGQNPIITLLDSNNASGSWDVLFTNIDMENRHTIQMSGDYQDNYVLQNDRWKIASMRFRQRSFLMHEYDDKGQPTAVSMGRGNENAFGK